MNFWPANSFGPPKGPRSVLAQDYSTCLRNTLRVTYWELEIHAAAHPSEKELAARFLVPVYAQTRPSEEETTEFDDSEVDDADVDDAKSHLKWSEGFVAATWREVVEVFAWLYFWK